MPVYLQHDGEEFRQNSINEPLNPDGKWVVGLHGGYGNPFDFRLTSELPSLFPDSYIFCLSAAVNDNNIWDDKNTQKDLNHLESLINALVGLYRLDYSNGVLIGISNGAMMGLRLANKLPFAKIISVSGTYNAPETFTYTGDILMINSTRDRIIPYLGNSQNNSINDSLSTMRQTATVQDVAITDTIQGSYYHTWNEIKQLTDLNAAIKGFV